MRHGWEIITDHKTRQAENILSFKLQQSVVSMLIGKWDLRLEKGERMFGVKSVLGRCQRWDEEESGAIRKVKNR